MLRKGVGAGFVSQVHANPCEEIRYLSLDPPVYQMIHIRYPKGRALTDPQKYLAGLLIRQRLLDRRYIPISSPEVQELRSPQIHDRDRRRKEPLESGRSLFPRAACSLKASSQYGKNAGYAALFSKA